MYHMPKDQDKPEQPAGGLGGLGHVDKKSPKARAAPRNLLDGTAPPPGLGTAPPPPGLGTAPPPGLGTSPYSPTSNSPPNFQRPTINNPPATNHASQVPQTMRGSRLGNIFAKKNMLWFGIAGALAMGGYLYTRDKDLSEIFADNEMED